MNEIPIATAFRAPDDVERVDHLVGYLDGATAVQRIFEGKQRRAALLTPVPGLSVLDVGCGTGDSLRMIAERVLPGGRAVGVDVSASLLEVGRTRAGDQGWSAEWVEADAGDLPFDDGEFDSALAERVLQHVEDPAAVLREMRRVIRPGGMVVLAEPDWGSLSVDAGDPAMCEVVARKAGALVRHRRVGRSLRRLLVEAGFVDVEVDAEVHVSADLALVRELALLDQAVSDLEDSGEIDGDLLRQWQKALAADAAAGRFNAALTLFVARGHVPRP